MDTGMLWFDNDPKTDLLSKVVKAAEYYNRKYGQEPNLCYVHPSMIAAEKAEVSGIVVCVKGTMIPNHYWIGVHHQPVLSS